MNRYDRPYRAGRPQSRYRGGSNFRADRPRRSYDADYDGIFNRPTRAPGDLANRVTRAYNADYVRGYRRDPYDRNYSMYTGDRPARMGDERYFRRPYLTIGGTRTYRGSSYPIGYDHPYNVSGGW